MKNLLYFLILLPLVSCTQKKEAIPPLDSPLVGQWTWVNSSGGFTGGTITPTSTGRTVELEFGSDYRFRRHANGKKEYETTYNLRKGETIYSNEIADQIIVNSSQDIYSYTIQDDILTLKEECYDCYTSVYKRKTTSTEK